MTAVGMAAPAVVDGCPASGADTGAVVGSSEVGAAEVAAAAGSVALPAMVVVVLLRTCT